MTRLKHSVRTRAFLDDLVALMKKHDVSLGHEDHHGVFEVAEGFDSYFADWIAEAGVVALEELLPIAEHIRRDGRAR